MCLHHLVDKKETLKRCAHSTIDGKPCLVGYKIIQRDDWSVPGKKKNVVLSPMVKYRPYYHQKWNGRVDVQSEPHIYTNDLETYPTGIHVYLNKKMAQQYFEYRCHPYYSSSYALIPVYFFATQVLATGIQVHSDGTRLEIPTAVTTRFYMKPSTYEKLMRTKNHST
jgi:hypothetical protein